MTSPLNVDLDFGLRQLSGNRTLLIKLLNSFCDEYRQLPDKLQALSASGDSETFRNSVHTVKGVSGNLGLNNVHQCAKSLEQAVKNGAPIEMELRRFSAALTQTITEVQALSDANSAEEVPAAESTSPTSASVQAKDKLQSKLRNNAYILPDELKGLLDSLGISPEQAAELHSAIDQLDYHRALELLSNCGV